MTSLPATRTSRISEITQAGDDVRVSPQVNHQLGNKTENLSVLFFDACHLNVLFFDVCHQYL
jgi:hypothetical protein